jgi:acetylornithine deacetylase/succinyl-diaminopimelate desuccinylase-like protein
MRTVTRFGLFVLIILAAGAALLPVHAQDAKVACDADLILSLYTAENSFNYAAVADKVMAAHPDMAMVDMTKLDYGQFTPLFTAMMGIPTLDGLGPQGDGLHALHEQVVVASLPRRATLLAGMLKEWHMD